MPSTAPAIVARGIFLRRAFGRTMRSACCQAERSVAIWRHTADRESVDGEGKSVPLPRLEMQDRRRHDMIPACPPTN